MDRAEEKKTILGTIFTRENAIIGGSILIGTAIGLLGGYYVYEHLYNKKEHK